MYPPPPVPEPAAFCVPFAQASFQQVSQAMLFAESALVTLPVLSWEAWANAFLIEQPYLWVGQETVYFDRKSLGRVYSHLLDYHLNLPGEEHPSRDARPWPTR